jgi:prolipoprotein diacylglyceryltransferase
MTPLRSSTPRGDDEPSRDTTTRAQRGLNRLLDAIAVPRIHLLNRSWSSFHLCGVAGLVLAVTLAMTLTVRSGLSAWVMAGLVVAAMSTFLIVAMLTKIVTGAESLTYYHHHIAVLAVGGLVLHLAGVPPLPSLEIGALGIGAFLAIGRIGCLMVGCCHGGPHRWGVRYGDDHAEAGFARHLVGVRLFPLQLVESAYVLAIVALGFSLVFERYPAGYALATYVVLYGICRFFGELFRGDCGRMTLLNLTEAQWTSLLLPSCAVLAEWFGALPFVAWHLGATAMLLLAAAVVLATRARRPHLQRFLREPDHVRQIADVVESIAAQESARVAQHADPRGIAIARTSHGLRMSGGTLTGREEVTHYTFSDASGAMAGATALDLAELVMQLRHPVSSASLRRANRDVFHLLVKR